MGNLTEKMVLIPECLIKCTTTLGFISEVKNRACKAKSIKQAYHDVEEDFQTYFGFRKYSDFNSFRVIYTRYRKK